MIKKLLADLTVELTEVIERLEVCGISELDAEIEKLDKIINTMMQTPMDDLRREHIVYRFMGMMDDARMLKHEAETRKMTGGKEE